MLTAVSGILLGHVTHLADGTGCTVIIPPEGTTGAVDVRGGGAGSRETEAIGPFAGERDVSAILLAGGSAFGLAAASGVARWCEADGRGVDTGAARVPIVPAAVIYDLGLTGNGRRPDEADGEVACQVARSGPHDLGSVGAGTGATVGKVLGQRGWCKGGIGAASCVLHDGVTVAALAVVNAFGDVVDSDGSIIAGAWEGDGWVDAGVHLRTRPPEHPRLVGQNTTLAVVATDAVLTRAEAGQVARMAQAGVARAVIPAHTLFDGDVVFALATGTRPGSVFLCGTVGAEMVADAIRSAVRAASSVRGVPTAAERRASGGE
jgi:L-aminopeptidase/D-esterase-like protein